MATGLPACSRPGGSLLLSSCVRIAFYLIPKMPLPFVLFMIDFVSLLNFKTKTFKHENVFPWSWGQGGLNLYMLPRIPKKKIMGSGKSDCLGMGERVLKTGPSLNLCPHICVPITALTFSIPVVTTLAEGTLDRGHMRRGTLFFFFFFFTRISLELSTVTRHMENVGYTLVVKKPNSKK